MTNEELQAMLAAAYSGNFNQSLRTDGTPKGYGWLGNLKGTGKNAGHDMTEYSVGVEFDGKQYVIPSMVPTLSEDELNHILGGGEVTRPIMVKAVEHAKARMAEGKSVWADTPPYTPGINKANMGLDYGPPKSEWESYKYNVANPGRTTAEPIPEPMALADYPKVWYDRIIGNPLKGMAGAGDALLGRTNPDMESFEKDVLDALSLYAGAPIAKGMLGGIPRTTQLNAINWGGTLLKDKLKKVSEEVVSVPGLKLKDGTVIKGFEGSSHVTTFDGVIDYLIDKGHSMGLKDRELWRWIDTQKEGMTDVFITNANRVIDREEALRLQPMRTGWKGKQSKITDEFHSRDIEPSIELTNEMMIKTGSQDTDAFLKDVLKELNY